MSLGCCEEQPQGPSVCSFCLALRGDRDPQGQSQFRKGRSGHVLGGLHPTLVSHVLFSLAKFSEPWARRGHPRAILVDSQNPEIRQPCPYSVGSISLILLQFLRGTFPHPHSVPSQKYPPWGLLWHPCGDLSSARKQILKCQGERLAS